MGSLGLLKYPLGTPVNLYLVLYLSSFLSAGAGADANRPPCRKAKELRKERRFQKEQERHNADAVVSSLSRAPTQINQPKPLEDFISESLMNNSAHRLEVSTMTSKSYTLAFVLITAALGLQNVLSSVGFKPSPLLTPVTSPCVCVHRDLATAGWKNHFPHINFNQMTATLHRPCRVTLLMTLKTTAHRSAGMKQHGNELVAGVKTVQNNPWSWFRFVW